MPVHEDVQLSQHPAFTVHWYFICGIVLGSVGFLVGLSVVAYQCRRRRAEARDPQTRLSAAIKKGLKESSNHGSLHKSPSTRSTASAKSAGSGSGSQKGGTRPGPPDLILPDKHMPKSPSAHSPIDPQHIKMDCYAEEDETSPVGERGATSPGTEKQDSTKEDQQKKPSLGQLYFSVDYDKQKTALVVTVVRAGGLPAKDANTGSADPYVKLQLLPEKRHKVKTRVLRKTLNPNYDEIFTFYGIQLNQLQAVTLHFVVLSFDRYSRDDIIGEVVYPLAGVQLGEREVSLTRDIQPRHIKMHSAGRGELLVSLCYQPAANRLTVVVLKSRNLPKMDITGLSDPYVKIYLLYNGQRVAKKKTHVKKRTLNPVFNESFLFDVPCNEGLSNISLEFQVLDWDRMTKNEVIGRLEVGTKQSGAEQHHWQEVINCPRKQIAEWHKLKEGAAPVTITITE